jgi:vesicle transport through interaction with t-SNAREs protein 1
MEDQNALFSQYETEYCNNSTEIARNLQVISTLSPDQRRGKLREAEAALKDADQVIKRMEMEARSFSPERARALLQKVKEYKADLASLRAEAKQASAAGAPGAAARAELGLEDDYYSTSVGQRERMLAATERLNKTGNRINQGQQQLLETEELGVSILNDLHRQRQTITNARDTLHGADDNIATARRVLATMSRRLMTNKLIMGGICLLLLGAIGLILYYKIIK